MKVVEALRSSSHAHAVHAEGTNRMHVIELPDNLAATYHRLGYFESNVPNSDVALLIITGPGKSWMDRRKMPRAVLSQFGIDINTVLAMWITSGSGVMSTLFSRDSLDNLWEPA